MKDMPKRQKILVAILAVLLLATAYMQLSGGGGDTVSTSTPSTPTNAVKPRSSTSQDSTGTTGTGGSATSGSSGMPADPTQAQRPQGVQITPVGGFPGTEPPIISFNPYIQPVDVSGSSSSPTG